MFYLFHGNDSYSQREFLRGLVAKLGDPAMLELNTTRFEAGQVSLGALRQACDTLPFLAPARLVICQGVLEQMPASPFLNELLAYLPDLPETTRLIFLESKSLPRNHPLLKLAENSAVGYVKHFTTPEGSALQGWVRQQAEEAGGQIEGHAAYLLANNAGPDLQVLANEIEKLVVYKGADGPISAADVTLLSPYAAETSIFALVDALGNRSLEQAALELQNKLAAGADPTYLFYMVIRQFRLLIQVKALAEEGASPPAIARELGLHRYVAGKVFQQSKQFTAGQLRQVYRHLLQIDLDVKTGQTDMATALSLLIAGIATS